jgi:hypothetical protein
MDGMTLKDISQTQRKKSTQTAKPPKKEGGTSNPNTYPYT